MKHVIVGTAGHIDHGKTELVKSLTGVDTDRLKEEQERGITIDIGFAPLPLGRDVAGGGPEVVLGFVDVPGHERFVKNMLAGVWGIDVVLLVIAADESIKPQTREHFDICSLLKVKRGAVALTKIDLVDSDLADLAALEVRDFVRGSFLEGAPIVPVSARTRQGLDRLQEVLLDTARQVEPGRGSALLRLPVDRSFSIRGFGTVVTGTIVSGAIAEGEEVAIYPEGRACRVRGLQVHGGTVRRAGAGNRTAVNLQGVEPASVTRGHVLAPPGALRPSSLLDVRLTLLPGAPAPLTDLSRVRFHQGTSELLARVKLLGAPQVPPGGEAYAQIRLERPGCCLPGDRFVIRRYSPSATIGGGVVLDAQPVKHRGAARPDLLSSLARLEGGDATSSLRVFLESEPLGLSLAGLAVRAGRTLAEVESALAAAIESGHVIRTTEGPTGFHLAREAAGALEGRVRQTLASYHRDNPLRPGMSREELREQALRDAAPEVVRFVLERMAAAGTVRVQKDAVSLIAHRVMLSPEDETLMRRLEGAFRGQGLNPPDLEALVQAERLDGRRATRVLHLLLTAGRLVRIRDGKVFHADALEDLTARLWALRAQHRIIDIGSFKELTGTSRKNAIPLLEHLDALKVTRRVGSDREILPPPGG